MSTLQKRTLTTNSNRGGQIASAMLAALLVAPTAFAGDALDLGTALGELPRAPQIEQARSSAEEASWRRVESYSGFLPSVTAGGQYLIDKKYVFFNYQLPGTPAAVSIPQILPTTTYTLGMTWNLFDGFANVDRLRASRAGERAGRHEYEWARFQGERQVILLFYRALAAQELRLVAEQNVKTIEDHLNDVRLLKSTGAGTKYDVYRVEVQASEAKSELLEAEDNVANSLLRLGEVLGHELEQRHLSGKLPILSPELIRDAAYDSSARADLEALSARAESAHGNSIAASKFWVPRISFFGQYQQYNNITNDIWSAANFRDAYMYGLQLNWNLFDGMSSIAKDQQAGEQAFQADKALAVQRAKARNDFEVWKRKYMYFCSVYEARKSDVFKSEETVRLAKEGRRVGTRTNADLLDAEVELFRARAGLVNSQLGSVEAMVNLELATGHKIYAFQENKN